MPCSRNFSVVAVATLQIGCFVACGRGRIDLVGVAKAAFEGFVYVGSYAADKYSPPAHSYDAQKLPAKFVPGRLYVFHYLGPLDDARFAVTQLPARLRTAGARVIEAPSSTAALPSVDPGDHVWRVVFMYQELRGTIYNALDRGLFERGGLTPGGNVNSFVLRFDPA